MTYHNDYIESEWWALKTIFDKGLLYKGYKIVPYCPRCGTPLSSHEVAQGLQGCGGRNHICPLQGEGRRGCVFYRLDDDALDVAIQCCPRVNPRETYAKVFYEGAHYYMAEALLDSVLGEGYEVEETFTGKELEVDGI